MFDRLYVTSILREWLRKPLALYIHILIYLTFVVTQAKYIHSDLLMMGVFIWLFVIYAHSLQVRPSDTTGKNSDYSDKPKRQRLELGDDGELVEIEDTDNGKVKRGNSVL